MPTCTRYKPKYDYIWQRCLTGAEWSKSIKRNFSAKPLIDVKPGFYIFHKELNIKGRNLIEYARMTQRDMFKTNTVNNSRNKIKDIVNSEQSLDQALTTTVTTNSLRLNTNTDEESNLTDDYVVKEKKEKKKKFSKIQAPDFKKTISRNQLNKVRADKNNVIPFSTPNYKWTTLSNYKFYI